MSADSLSLARPNARWTRIREFVTRPAAVAMCIALAALLLYWRTAYPSVLPGDAGELQFAAWGFWLAHPTGYPLYLTLGGIWQHLLPFGDPAYRLNLFSALWSGLAIGIAFLAFFQVTRARGAAAIAALTFAVSPLLWAQATRAEVYALNTFFVALLTLLGLMWRAQPQRKYAFAFALTFGLALTHHRMTLLLIPAFAALFAENVWSFRAQPLEFLKRALPYLGVAAIPLLLYLYIPLRAGATPYATLDISPAAPIVIFENSPRGWLNVILGSDFAGEVAWNDASVAALRALPTQWVYQFNWFGALVAVCGIGALLWRRKFAVAAFVIYGLSAFILFAGLYHIGDIEDYYTPAYFFACLALAEGIALLVQLLRTHPFTRGSTLPAIALLGFFALLPLQNLFSNFVYQNQRLHAETRVRWETLLKTDLPPNAILISNDRDEMTPLYYLQYVENKRPDLRGLFPNIAAGASYDNVIALVQRVAASERSIYALKPIPALFMKYIVAETKNGLWKIHTQPLPPLSNVSDATLDDALRVRGWEVIDGETRPGDSFTLRLQYEPLRALTRDYKFSLQLQREGVKVAQGDDHLPGEGEYPPTRWRAREILQDEFLVRLDPALEPGAYQLTLTAYAEPDGSALGPVEIGTLRVEE
ncbi:DUF2723 domain-containing protein [Anaerolineae bacterium CFX7]|nr:DUF2723 domain-containing protein [Anaerolineae bacterium CFX7]